MRKPTMTCNLEAVKTALPEMYHIEKTAVLRKEIIANFMKLDCITAEKKEELRNFITTERENDKKQYLRKTTKKFYEMFYTADAKKLEEMF